MDAYDRYVYILKTKQISVASLRRIIEHDISSGYKDACALARRKIIEDIDSGKIKEYKLDDERSDLLFGIQYPEPIIFNEY
jgi:hypothetical protein